MQQDSLKEKPASFFQPEERKPTPLAAEALFRAGSPDSVASSSLARWERLRQQVLPSAAHTASYGHSQQSSSVSSLVSPARPQTPKPSRLARLGFRHVAEQVRESLDVSRQFSDEIQKACWSSRHIDALKGSRFDRDGAAGSHSYLPFTSNPSLPTIIPGAMGASGHKDHDIYSPYPMHFLNTSSRPVPLLLNILRQHAPSSGSSSISVPYLPHENQVLSALLVPFLNSESGPGVDEERVHAVEAFEIAVKTWGAETKEVNHTICSFVI